MSSEFPELFVRLDTFSSALWYRSKPGRYRLEGTRCTHCGQTYFPPRKNLICPACHERAMEPYPCAQKGEVVCAAPDDLGFPAVGYGDYQPRIMVMIRLDDGIYVMSEIMECTDASSVTPGTRVKMVFRKHKREDSGAWVYGYRFVVDNPM